MTNTRIIIREHSLQDRDAYCDWQTDREVGKYLDWLPRTREEGEASFLDSLEQQLATPRRRFFFAIALRDTNEMIGDVGYTMTSPNSAECGWFLQHQYWRQGYATEAVQILIQYAFSQRGLDELTASCSTRNIASAKLMEAVGFKLIREAQTRKWFLLRRRP